MFLYFLTGLGLVLIFLVFYPDMKRTAHRREIEKKEFPQNHIEILKNNLPFYEKLLPEQKERLHKKIMVFLDEVRFEGCGGLELNDEIKLTISGQASMLLLNSPKSYYNIITSVLVYPTAYLAKTQNPDGTVAEESVRLGESWTTGTVVLAWDNVKHGISNTEDGHDVVLHEFAHQLDQEDGSGNGAPILPGKSAYSSWARVLGKEYKELKERKKKFKKSTLDKYGATNPAEFFAVATETFFEKPEQLQKKHPELFEELKKYYQIDPLRLID
jgi:Mlc titration factor MtfA (ptsG expression regulator)